jgi:apolipoprotein N-acyltransferase
VARQAPERVARTIDATVQLHDGRTVASRVGAWPEWLLAAVGVAAAVAGLLGAGPRRRTRGGGRA